MDSSHIELPGSQITAIVWEGSTLRVRFEPAVIIKRMTGSKERTRWRQDGTLILEGIVGAPLSGPATAHGTENPRRCTGGTIDDNLYSYRDMIPVPWVSRGRIRCEFALEGEPAAFAVDATAARLEMDGVPKYIEHLRT